MRDSQGQSYAGTAETEVIWSYGLNKQHTVSAKYSGEKKKEYAKVEHPKLEYIPNLYVAHL